MGKEKKLLIRKKEKKNDFFSECRTSYLHYTGGVFHFNDIFYDNPPPPFHGRFLGDFFRFFHLLFLAQINSLLVLPVSAKNILVILRSST